MEKNYKNKYGDIVRIDPTRGNNKCREYDKCIKCRKYDECDKNKKCRVYPNVCKNRNFRDDSSSLRSILGLLEEKQNRCINAQKVNAEEIKYINYLYSGSFQKGLQHDRVNGRLVSSQDYETMVNAIVKNDQKLLANVPLATGSTVKLANPLASLATVLEGAPQCTLRIDIPPALSTNSAAAEMLEIYAQVIARDVPFINYDTDPTIALLLKNEYLNNSVLLANLKYNCPGPFTTKTIFRGNTIGETVGPYISQLFLLNIPEGALLIPQKYRSPPSRAIAQADGFRVEWGVTLGEAVDMVNGNLNLLPPITPPNQLVARFINDGRTLAEAVHNDPPYQFFFQASQILLALGAQPNPGFPVYPNQTGFVTNFGIASIQSALADVTSYSLKHTWYWKWQHFRRLRPETFGVWVNDVKNGLVSNKNNFDLTNLILNSPILNQILDINNSWVPNSNSYTLPLAYREGSPLHPSYPGGHAAIAGACITVLKIYFDAEQPWLKLPGVVTGILSGIPNSIVQSNENGLNLVPYTEPDANLITIAGELNKLAGNDANGRDWAGIHYRSDWIQGIVLGQKVAIHYMEDLLASSIENNLDGSPPEITFTGIFGDKITIKPTTCRNLKY